MLLTPIGACMSNKSEVLSARLKAAYVGCYEAPRAAALSGVPVATVYRWARTGILEPSVSPTRIKLWSYADLMALRIVYWLRHPKTGHSGEVPASPMSNVRWALDELEQRRLDIWADSTKQQGSPLRVTVSGEIILMDEVDVIQQGTQQALPGMLNLLGPFDYGESKAPDLLRPRPHLCIVPGKVSGEPHIEGSRITSQVIAALYNRTHSVQTISEMYPGFSTVHFEEAVDLERSLAA